MLNKIRNVAFWTLDSIKGGEVSKAYKDLIKYYESDSTSTSLKDYQDKLLGKLLKQATQNTIFYKKYIGKTNLFEYPVVNKNIIRNNQSNFLSNKYEKNKLFQMSTSGSTGTPFTSYQNIEKKRRVNAETIFFNGLAGYQVGEKLINLRSLNIKSQKSKLVQFMQNEKLIDIDRLDEKSIRELCSEIEKYTSTSYGTLLSYASTYDALRGYFERYGHELVERCNINGIISTSEILNDLTRNYISKAFGCNCYSRYANMENGMLGQDTPAHPNAFILNEANYFIEILKMDIDEPAEFGELGRVVVTDLYNNAMPMIRYDTGDVGTFTYLNLKGKKKKAITNFGGRQIDMIFDSSGQYISPHKISVTFWGFDELKQFQFIQIGQKEYRVLLQVNEGFYKKNELESRLKAILGKAAVIEFEEVKTIPVLNSGKRKYIINKTVQN